MGEIIGTLQRRSEAAHPVDQHVGAKVRSLRKQLGMSQQALGDKCDVSFQQIQKYERGANRISCSALVRIATALGVAPGHFVDDAPGAPGALPAHDDWAEARDVLSTVPGVMAVLGCLKGMPPELRRPWIAFTVAACGRRPETAVAA